MRDGDKKRSQLIRELEELRKKVAELEAAEAKRRQTQAALRAVGLEITAQLDLDAVLHSVASRAVDLLQGTNGGLYLYRPERDVLEWAVPVNLNPAPVGVTLRRGEGLAGKVWETGEPMIVEDYQNWQGRAAVFDAYAFTSVLEVPVHWGDTFLGVLNVNGPPGRQFSRGDIKLLSMFATQAAIAIRNARLYDQAQSEIKKRVRAQEERERLLAAERKQRQLAETLIAVTNTLNSSLDREQVLQSILEQLARVVEYDSASLMLIFDDRHEIVAHRGFRSQDQSALPVQFGTLPHAQKVLETRRPLIIPDTRKDAGWHRRSASSYIRCWLGVPVVAQDQVIGILNLDKEQLHFYTQRHAEIAVAFANQAAIAIENARLYEQARQDAQTKATLLHEVNHRVKNNLSAIIGLLYTERHHAGMENQPIYQAIIEDLTNRVQGLATVHNMLSATEWAPLPLDELTTRIIDTALQMRPLDKQIQIDVSSSPVRVSPRQANNLALVINELTTNTAKYALQARDKACIDVNIALEDLDPIPENVNRVDRDRIVVLEFRNDGPGYPEEVLRVLDDNVGLRLIRTLVEQGLQGELTLLNEPSPLTVVRFPVDSALAAGDGSRAGELSM